VRTDEVLQSEEARSEFDKEPGHDKLKVSIVWRGLVDLSDKLHRRRRIRCSSRCLCMILWKRTILGGERNESLLFLRPVR
jgi:hypothetical protein